MGQSQAASSAGTRSPRQTRDAACARRLVQFALDDSDALLYHNEPIWRDGIIVGETTSGMFGHTIGQSLGMGYVTNTDGIADAAYINAGTYEIEVAGQRIPATASLQPFYDPKSTRVKV